MWLLEGDLYEDGMYMKNGFFRTRHFKHHGSETSMDLFSEDRNLDNTEECDIALRDSQSEAMKRKERLEKEEFIRKFRVSTTGHTPHVGVMYQYVTGNIKQLAELR